MTLTHPFPAEFGTERSDYRDAEFRDVMARFASGITVITGMAGRADGGAEPVGFTCQSFSSLSLDPPMVLFCPAKTSGTWRELRSSGRFTVNMLAESQERVSAVFAQRGSDRFDQIAWETGEFGTPRIDGALAHVDAELVQVVEAGDHDIAIGRVLSTARRTVGRPLVYFGSRYQTLAW